MKHLNLAIPEWVLRRWITISVKEDNTLTIVGVEPDGTPATILRKVELLDTGATCSTEPYEFQMKNLTEKLKIRLHFMGNYNEPPKEFEIDVKSGKKIYDAVHGERIEKKLRFEFRCSKPDWDVIEEY